MQKNVHDLERIGRVIGGAFLSSLAFWGPKKPWYLAFAIPVITGFTGKCPLYGAMDISTRSKSTEDQANDYFPVQSTSERAAGHPIVGLS